MPQERVFVNLTFRRFLEAKLSKLGKNAVIDTNSCENYEVIEIIEEAHSEIEEVRKQVNLIQTIAIRFFNKPWPMEMVTGAYVLRKYELFVTVRDETCLDKKDECFVYITVYSDEWKQILSDIASEYEERMKGDSRNIEIIITREFTFKKHELES